MVTKSRQEKGGIVAEIRPRGQCRGEHRVHHGNQSVRQHPDKDDGTDAPAGIEDKTDDKAPRQLRHIQPIALERKDHQHRHRSQGNTAEQRGLEPDQ